MLLRRNRLRRPADLIDVVDETGGTLTEPAAREVEAIYWFHSIDLGNGMVTPGAKSVETQQLQLEALNLPDLSGKRVLDIGAWDGFFSFEAERRGAAHVTTLTTTSGAWTITPTAATSRSVESEGRLPSTSRRCRRSTARMSCRAGLGSTSPAEPSGATSFPSSGTS